MQLIDSLVCNSQTFWLITHNVLNLGLQLKIGRLLTCNSLDSTLVILVTLLHGFCSAELAFMIFVLQKFFSHCCYITKNEWFWYSWGWCGSKPRMIYHVLSTKVAKQPKLETWNNVVYLCMVLPLCIYCMVLLLCIYCMVLSLCIYCMVLSLCIYCMVLPLCIYEYIINFGRNILQYYWASVQ